jgi:hypothetical protein
VLGGGLAIAAAFVGIMELRLAARGFKPDIVDSSRAWSRERARADALGSRALIMVGSSRVLLDPDFDVLRRDTGLEPVQLGVDGSSFVPVLAGLAADPKVTGTIVVDLAENVLASPMRWDGAYDYERDYERQQQRFTLPDFDRSEAYLSDWLRGRLRSYADGAHPLTTLQWRVLHKDPTPQYLRMLPDREILADYSQVPQPQFYYQRVIRNLGEDVPTAGRSYYDIEHDFAARIAVLPALDDKLFEQSLPALAAMTRAIQARGGRVIFTTFPTSGYIRQMDDRRFPRQLFWDRFVAAVPAPAVNFEDVPALRAFYCPDGSHLDYHARPAFTHLLVRALHLEATR